MNEESGASNQTESLGRDREVSASSLDSVDVGETLRRVRESRGISLHEASMALKLSLKQVEALTEVGKGPGKQVVLLPAAALDAFKDAFAQFRGKA